MSCAIVYNAGLQSQCLCIVISFMTVFAYEKCSLLFLYTALKEFQSTAGHFNKTRTHKKHTGALTRIYAHRHTRSGCQQRRADEGRATADREAEDGLVKTVSCSQTETGGRHCCCWEGRGGPGRTAARPGWSAQEEA